MGVGSLLPSSFFSYYLKFYLVIPLKRGRTAIPSPLATSRKKACKKVYASKIKSLRISKEACTALEQIRLDHDIETWSDRFWQAEIILKDLRDHFSILVLDSAYLEGTREIRGQANV
jgi:hypothetical protein